MSGTLGIIAGGDRAPFQLVQALERAGRKFFLFCLKGHADEALPQHHPHIWLKLGEGEKLLNAAKSAGVYDVVMIGRVRRPSLLELQPDALALKTIARVGLNMLGDDGLLKAIARTIEEEGFRLIAPQDIWRDDLMPAGFLTSHRPDDQAMIDLRRAYAVAKQLGLADVGQAVVVQQGLVLGVEAIEGTQALLQRAATLRREGGGGVLLKICKPQQDKRFDLPAMGAATVADATAAGLVGVALQAGAGLLLERAPMLAAAEQLGLFVWGFSPAELEENG
ncbi:MAG: LpxI family protein [Alphaproteobacteria bacterium]|nr:LpxI family protein [Alphaproteobacteria bacterium]